MNSIFSSKLYLQGLRKVRTAGIAMAIVIIVMNAWIPIQCISAGRISSSGYATEVGAGMFAPFGFALILFAPLLVYNMFSYLNERKSSDFFHSLPQKRICVYISFMSAVFTWIVSVLCVTSIVNTVLWAMADGYVLSLKAVVLTLVGFLILALVTAGFMALAMTLTGTAVANFLVFILFFLFIRACGMFFLYGFSNVTPMFNLRHSWLKIFDVQFFLPVGLIEQVFDGNGATGSVWFFLYWTAVGIALIALSAWTYCRRRSESATKSAPNRIMQNIYRVGVTFPFLMMGVFLFISDKDFYLCLLCGFVAFLVWVIFELLTTRKIKNVVRSVPMLLIPAILAGGYAASVYLTRNIFYASTPEREKIESVKLVSPWNSFGFDNYDTGIKGWDSVILQTTEITDPEILDKVYEAIGHTKEALDMTWDERREAGYIYSESVTLTLTSGRRVSYNLRSSHNLFAEFMESPQIRELLLTMCGDDVDSLRTNPDNDISASALEQIWSTFKAEFGALTDAQKSAYLRLNSTGISNAAHITAYGTREGYSFYQDYAILSEYTPEAYKLYMQYAGNGKKWIGELQAMQSRLEEMQADEASYAHMSITSYTWGNTFSVHCSDYKVIKEFLTSIQIDSHLTDYENAKTVYRFILQLDMPVATPTDDEPKSTSRLKEQEYEKTESYEWFSVDTYLTFSDADLERYMQILNYPAKPAK